MTLEARESPERESDGLRRLLESFGDSPTGSGDGPKILASLYDGRNVTRSLGEHQNWNGRVLQAPKRARSRFQRFRTSSVSLSSSSRHPKVSTAERRESIWRRRISGEVAFSSSISAWLTRAQRSANSLA